MALVRADRFMGVMQKEQLNIRCEINQAMADQIASNRQILASIIKTILLCGRQNIALRGHRDSAMEKDTFENYGNFWALLQFRVDAGDKILQEHLSTASRNALYTSSTIQNQIMAIICSELQQKIFEKVQKAKWFTLIADEVTDVSNKKLLSIALRYIDDETGFTREDFVSFLECETGISGHCLAQKITTSLRSYGLDLTNLHGQAYDGAGNMAGSVKNSRVPFGNIHTLCISLFKPCCSKVLTNNQCAKHDGCYEKGERVL